MFQDVICVCLHVSLSLMFVSQSCMPVPANMRATPCVLTQFLVQLDVLCFVAGKQLEQVKGERGIRLGACHHCVPCLVRDRVQKAAFVA